MESAETVENISKELVWIFQKIKWNPILIKKELEKLVGKNYINAVTAKIKGMKIDHKFNFNAYTDDIWNKSLGEKQCSLSKLYKVWCIHGWS